MLRTLGERQDLDQIIRHEFRWQLANRQVSVNKKRMGTEKYERLSSLLGMSSKFFYQTTRFIFLNDLSHCTVWVTSRHLSIIDQLLAQGPMRKIKEY